MARARHLDVPRAAMELTLQTGEASLLAALEEIRLVADTDGILRRAVELARDRLGLQRVGLFVLDRSRNAVQGTWGTNLSGGVVDQHDVVCELSGTDLEALRQWEQEGAYFTVFPDRGAIGHRRGKSHAASRGWIVKTPVRSTREAIAMLVNGSGSTGEVVDEVKQAHAAIFCSTLGTMLDDAYGQMLRSVFRSPSPSQKMVASSIEMLEKDPGLGAKQLAAALNTSVSRFASLFKIVMGLSLVEYRNRLRFVRFQALVRDGNSKLRDAARQAGFGSYAQFHRIFRARTHASPRQYLRPPSADGCLPPKLRDPAPSPSPSSGATKVRSY